MLLRVKNLQKQYPQFQLNCSLEVSPGRIVGLVGQNGAGKSTTFRAVLGLLRPDAGSIQVLGKEPEKLSPEDRKKIGVVLADSGFSGLLTLEQVSKIMEGLYDCFDRTVFMKKAGELGLPDHKAIKEFSTGMRAKLKVLLALSHRAQLLLLDEPTAGLDVVARRELLELLRDFMDEDNLGILISSHISTDLEGLCDEMYMIHQGKIVLWEETDVLLSAYGIIKADTRQYQQLDASRILRRKKESYGYSCLTSHRQFYQENYPGLVVEKATLDEVIDMMIRGEKL